MLSGMFGVINLNNSINSIDKEHFEKYSFNTLLNDYILYDSLYLERHLNNKFFKDKIFNENEDYLIAIDGIIINASNILKSKYDDLFNCLINLYEDKKLDFVKYIKGNYFGVFYDKKKNIKYIFNSAISTKTIYYSVVNNKFIFATNINYITDYFKKNNYHYSLNLTSVKNMMSTLYLCDDLTFINEIKRLTSGYCVIIKNDNIDIKKTYKPLNVDIKSINEQEAIDKINQLYRKAIKRAFEKDKEYNYNHIVSLSGGLDCKAVTCVAHELGYTDMLNITYSQTGHWDEIVPKQIASDLRHKWAFYSLDNGVYALDIDEFVTVNAGSTYYLQVSQGKKVFETVNLEEYGLLHTGLFSDIMTGRFLCGDVTNGYVFELENHKLEGWDKNLCKVFSPQEISNFKDKYDNNESFLLNLIGINTENLQQTSLNNYTEVYSPYFDVELLDFLASLPLEMRLNNNIHKKWIINKYPKVANYIWDKTNAPLSDKEVIIPWNNTVVPVSRLFIYLKTKLLRKIIPGIKQKRNVSKEKIGSMNPREYWYNTNPKLKKTMDDYFYKNIEALKFDEELYKAGIDKYLKGTMLDKTSFLTILGVMKNYFDF